MKATIQPQGMSVSSLSLKCDPVALQMALAEVDISIIGYFYAVDFGPGVRPQHHRVGENAYLRRCSASHATLGELCPAVDAVRAYLAAGGERAPEPPPGYYPVIPARFPIVMPKSRSMWTKRSFALSSRYRGAGWRCEVGGSAHYWQRMGQASALKSAQKWAIQQDLPPLELLPADDW